ncbi:hypothetical protein HispidOSU_027290 [Sigmodon hispidus]
MELAGAYLRRVTSATVEQISAIASSTEDNCVLQPEQSQFAAHTAYDGDLLDLGAPVQEIPYKKRIGASSERTLGHSSFQYQDPSTPPPSSSPNASSH